MKFRELPIIALKRRGVLVSCTRTGEPLTVLDRGCCLGVHWAEVTTG